MDLRQHIRNIPDFPKPGILFRDVTTLVQNPEAFRYAIQSMAERFESVEVDAIAGIDARGFMFAAPLALRLDVPLVIIRKRGKLPFDTYSQSYDLEYGTDSLEIHVDAVSDGDRVLLVDDLLATGGSLSTAAALVERTGGIVAGICVAIELSELRGRNALAPHRTESLVTY
ncbi:MAG: adenine phosphoribosyltransferase [Dehalococcoidia bacterium]|nr:adenine phosphoribosyltransferase [Dehalococcoidia bacterium]